MLMHISLLGEHSPRKVNQRNNLRQQIIPFVGPPMLVRGTAEYHLEVAINNNIRQTEDHFETMAPTFKGQPLRLGIPSSISKFCLLSNKIEVNKFFQVHFEGSVYIKKFTKADALPVVKDFNSLPAELRLKIWNLAMPASQELGLDLQPSKLSSLASSERPDGIASSTLVYDKGNTISVVAHVNHESRQKFLLSFTKVQLGAMKTPRYIHNDGALRIGHPDALGKITNGKSDSARKAWAGSPYQSFYRTVEISEWLRLQKPDYYAIRSVRLANVVIDSYLSSSSVNYYSPTDISEWISQLSWFKNLECVILIGTKVSNGFSVGSSLLHEPKNETMIEAFKKDCEQQLFTSMKHRVKDNRWVYGRNVSTWWVNPKIVLVATDEDLMEVDPKSSSTSDSSKEVEETEPELEVT